MLQTAGSLNASAPACATLTGVLAESEVPPSVFLRRLRRLLLLRYQAAQYLDQHDVRLLDRCIYTTYCDCQSLGVDSAARQLLEEARAGGERLLAWRPS